jgi:hypothetical protein
MESVNRRLEAAKNKQSMAENLEVPRSTLRKRLKTGAAPTSLGRFKAAFSNEEKGLIFWGNSPYSIHIFRLQKKVIRIYGM